MLTPVSVPCVGLCDRPRPSPSVSSGAPEFLRFSWETTSPEAPPGEAAWQRRPEMAELLAHLRANLLPWDESILETLSPKLIAGEVPLGGTEGVAFCC